MIAGGFDPQHDELLYSALARLREWMRYPTENCIWNAAFGSASAVAVVDLPGHIDTLLANLAPGHGLEADSLVLNHTTLPYYLPFIEPWRASLARDALAAGSSARAGGVLGIRASTVPTPAALRHCPSCADEDRARCGFPTWRRAHQLPGVYVCPTHEVPLKESAVPRTNRPSRQVFTSALSGIAESDQDALPAGADLPLLRSVARATAWLLDKQPAPPGLAAIHARYHEHLTDAGFARGAMRLAAGHLREALIARYGEPALRAMGCTLRPGRERDDWLARLLRRPRRAQHPLHHLVLLDFLGCGPADVLTPSTRRAPRQASASPCPNPICLRRTGTHPVTTGSHIEPTVTCALCGYSYRCSGNPGARTTVIAYGPVWEEKLRTLVGDATVSLRKAAKKLGVDPKTLQRQARRLGVWRIQWGTWARCAPAQRRQEKANDTRAQHRTAWRRLRHDHPEEPVRDLRQRAASTYSYLYRYDRDWLEAHRPPAAASHEKRLRVDWTERDAQLLQATRAAVSALLATPGRPTQLRLAEIGRRTGNAAVLEKHLDKLPRTAAYLATALEDRAAWAARKVRWATAQFLQEGTAPLRWAFIRRAGLRPDLADLLARDIDKALAELREGTREPLRALQLAA